MSILLRFTLILLSMTVSMEAFAAVKTPAPAMYFGVFSTGTWVTATSSGESEVSASGWIKTDSGITEEDAALKKDKEKTINDINTFLIESYKLKIDKILSNLNISLERITNNDPIAQAKLLEKIRTDIDSKIQIINSRNISENRKKILSSVFSYIQENLDTKISKLVQEK